MVPEPRSVYALRFFFLAAVLLAAVVVVATFLLRLFPAEAHLPSNRFSVGFAVSTCLLFAGSACLQRAVAMVRIERQRAFRTWLIRAICCGTLFVAVQTYALTCLVRLQHPEDATAPGAAFIVVLATLHGMHFVIALLFLSHVTIQAFADRYDHEYFFGVVVCSWFWHVLGLAWCAILGVMLIVRLYA